MSFSPFRRFPRRPAEGFSLIELLVVLVIMGVLLAIVVPTFLGQQRRAQDREAQAALRTVQTGARALLVWDQDRPDFESLDPEDDDFWAEEIAQNRFPEVSDVYADPAASVRCNNAPDSPPDGACALSGASEAADDVSIVNVDAAGVALDPPAPSKAVFMAALSRSGSCWVVLDDLDRGVSYGVVPSNELPAEGCDALVLPSSTASESEFPPSP